ncbi:uncharacterized protein KGF55_000363 [Candida pseudojiufengensis]|uniref:uncharacterized protein n=1 Tax=Candida pseudojiufengensis TaxID=497109 RepID=UPI002223F5F1|nr:uncharacterized protein KGF55_000363 [Candida pseudojiufengensis]KAI5966954.1 hypothetical protein KGF55_000363 [Candida pseudojiufengensis]
MSWKKVPFRPILAGLVGTVLASTIAYKYGQSSIKINQPIDILPFSSTTKLNSIKSPKYCKNISNHIEEFKKLGIEVSNSKLDIEFHTGNEFTTHKPLPGEIPQYILYPKSTEEVSAILKICNKYSIPVVPFSGGSSLEGHFHSTRQGIVIDTSKMNKVLQINENDLDVVVQCGVNWLKLNEILEPYKLMMGVDCGTNGQIGGMISTNASGISASRYGAMSANVISITAVLADGTIIKTRQRPRKSSAGYNLTNLFIGSEGTLGIVTEAVVKVYPIPKSETVVVVQFPSIKSATQTVEQVFRSGMQPSAIEMLDGDMMHCLNYSGYTSDEWLEVPTIFFKIGGLNDIIVKENIKILKEITKKNKAENFIFAKSKEQGDELFSARKNAFYAMIDWGRNEIDEDVRIWVTDIAVPISRLSYVLDTINGWMKSSGFSSIILAHVGDGNFHADIFYKKEKRQEVEDIVNKMIKLGIDNDGTCTGEHSIGISKRKFLQLELGDDTIDMMRTIKLALDPKRILNPDKIFKIDPNDKGLY